MAPTVTNLKVVHPQGPQGVTREKLDAWRAKRAPLTVAIPLMEMVPRALVLVTSAFAKRMKPGDDFLFNDHSAAVNFVRNEMIERFLATESQWLFFMDDDMVVGAEWLDIMTGYDVPLISGFCTRKSYPFLPTCSMLDHYNKETGNYHYNSITSFMPRTGVYDVDAVGAGFLCIRRDVLEEIGSNWFEFLGGGEDFSFCRKVAANGHKIFVDTHCVVGHIRDEITTIDDFLKIRHTLSDKEKQYELAGDDPVLDFAKEATG
jgi:hypothetical protein